ncbi:MAG: homoserine dehydrogenase [Eubacteriaceae bacterium]|nr:homoserine dehydrogenase [Eubacteriaceae bacterium]
MSEIGLLGLGTVGSGVYEIINLKRGTQLKNESLHVKRVLVRDMQKKRSYNLPTGMITDSFEDILSDPEISIVVCVMGGLEPEFTYIKQALSSGKHVVTANKEVMALHINELLDIAQEHGAHLLYEASVGGGIPVIDSIVELLKINRITRIHGILNGTTNFILTKIAKEKREFSDVLREAQSLGFAEADPSADVDGFDVMRKISILASLCFHTVVQQHSVHQRGIGNITLEDILMADFFGYTIKYIGKAVMQGDRYSVSVTPVLLRKDSVIANVNAEYNIVVVEGDIIGELCFIGKGAGKDATANAVVSDILKIKNGEIHRQHIDFHSGALSYGIEGLSNRYFVRVSIGNYDEFSAAVDLISASVEKDRLIYQGGMLFFTTEAMKSTDMKLLSTRLDSVACDIFYARLDHSLM